MRLRDAVRLLDEPAYVWDDFEIHRPGQFGSKCDVAYATSTVAVKRAEELPAMLLLNARSKLDVQSLAHRVKCVVLCENPRLSFIRILNELFPNEMSVHPTAVVYPGTILGNRVSVHANAVIGADGFGYERDEEGMPHKFSHIGRVVIGDNVEIGAGSCIDRGALSDTVIGNNVKIDNLVHVAHGVTIGDNTLIAASAMIAGSAHIGSGVWIGPHATISNGITIGDNAFIAIGSRVLRDVGAGGRVT